MKRPDDEPTGEPARPAVPSRPDHGETPPATKGAARRRWPGWFALLVALAMAGGAGWWWFEGRQPAEAEKTAQPKGIPVQVAEVRTADVPIFLHGLGTVQAFNTVLVRSRVDGEITRIAFTEGQFVREGDVLATIDPRPYRAALDQAIARKAQDEATLRSNRLDLDRTRQLAERDFASRQQFDQQTAAVGAQEAVVRADQAVIDNARTQLDYTTIRSPLTGRLGLRLVDQGNIVRSSDTTGIVEVAQLQPISVLFTAPEGQLRSIQDAMAAGQVEVVALTTDDKTVLGTGTLALINNQVDAGSGTVRLKATFPNEDNRLWPGLSVNTKLRLRVIEGATVVPDSAVMRGQGGLFAFAVSGESKAEERKIDVGEFSEGAAVIRDGLKPGERVVTTGQSRLRNETLVEVGEGKEGGVKPGREKPEGRPTEGRASEAASSTARGGG